MIKVNVNYYVLFFIAAGGKFREEVELWEDSTVLDLLHILSKRHGNLFASRIWDSRGIILSTIWIMVNGIRINDEDWQNSVLNDRDVIIISTPMLVGG